MNKMTGSELLSKFETWREENDVSSREFGWGEFAAPFEEDEEEKYEENEKDFLDQFGKIEYVLCGERLSSGDHDTAQTIILFREHDVYLSLDGYYNSNEGTDFSYAEFDVVEPVQVTYTEYRKKG